MMGVRSGQSNAAQSMRGRLTPSLDAGYHYEL